MGESAIPDFMASARRGAFLENRGFDAEEADDAKGFFRPKREILGHVLAGFALDGIEDDLAWLPRGLQSAFDLGAKGDQIVKLQEAFKVLVEVIPPIVFRVFAH